MYKLWLLYCSFRFVTPKKTSKSVKISSELLQVPPITNWSAGANGEVVVEAPLRLASDHLHTSIVVKTSLFPGKLAS